MNDLVDWLGRLKAFEAEASTLLGSAEGALRSRTYNAHESLEKVSQLTFEQADSLKQAVRCVEANLHQAALVMAWTAVADLLLEVAVKESAQVTTVRDKWKYTDKVSLAEGYGDYAIAEALKAAEVISKSQMKSIHGLLHRRNECAHRTDIFPTPNEALGYIDEVIQASKILIDKLS